MAVKAVPDEYGAVTPYLYFKGASQAIEFYKKAFGATERMRMPGPGDTVGHAEIEINGRTLMLADLPEKSPGQLHGTTVSLLLYVDDADAVFKRAIGAGASVISDVENKFYGDRMGTLRDPFGHEWSIGTHVEDVSPAEMQTRMQAAMASMSST